MLGKRFVVSKLEVMEYVHKHLGNQGPTLGVVIILLSPGIYMHAHVLYCYVETVLGILRAWSLYIYMQASSAHVALQRM